MSKRLFVAIPLSDSIKNQLAKLSQPLEGAKWVAEDNLHVTVAFLGDTDEALIAPIDEALQAALRGFTSFSLAYKELVLIPDQPHRARMLWAEYESSKEYCDLVQSVQAAVAPLHSGFALNLATDPKTPRAHITLARAKKDGAFRDYQIPESSLPRLEVHTLELIESVLTSSGPQYTVLHDYSL